jgi:hypothetical protein
MIRSYRGFNLFDAEDERLFEALARGEFNISGFQNNELRRLVGRTYKYYLTGPGKQVITLGQKLKNLSSYFPAQN